MRRDIKKEIRVMHECLGLDNLGEGGGGKTPLGEDATHYTIDRDGRVLMTYGFPCVRCGETILDFGGPSYDFHDALPFLVGVIKVKSEDFWFSFDEDGEPFCCGEGAEQ